LITSLLLENNNNSCSSSNSSTTLSLPYIPGGGVGQEQGQGGVDGSGVGGVAGGTMGMSPAPTNDTIQLYGSFVPPTPSSSSSSSAPRLLSKAELYGTIESYLLSGRREEAVATAVLHKEWTLALLISSNCGEEEYREVSKAFAVATFPSASPLHLAALLFSSQV
jgi:Sec23-binding domain of Sec16